MAKRFHEYVFGRPVIVQSDHKPLEAIVRKPLNKAPAGLQGMLLQLQRYDLYITYTPDKHMYIADALSRATTSRDGNNVNENPCDEKVVYAMEAMWGSRALTRLNNILCADTARIRCCLRSK